MKKYLPLLLLGFIFLAPHAHASVSEIQVATNTLVNTASGVTTSTFGSAVTAGDLIVAGCFNQSNNAFPANPFADNKGDTYTLYTSSTPAGNHKFITGYTANAPSGVTAVSCKESSSAGHGGMWAAEFSGIATTNVTDASGTFSATASTTPWASPPITTTNAADLLVGFDVCVFGSANCTTVSASSPWSLSYAFNGVSNWDGGNGGNGLMEWQSVSTTGTYQAQGTSTATTNNNYSMVMSFKGAAAATVPSINPYVQILAFNW